MRLPFTLRMKTKLRTKLLIYILSTTTIIFAATLIFVVVKTKRISEDSALRFVDANAREFANVIKSELEGDFAACRSLAMSFSSYRLIPDKERTPIYNQSLKNVLLNNPQFVSVWTDWELNNIDPTYKREHGRESFTFYKEGKEIKYTNEITDTIDNPSGIYYDIKANPSEILTDPYWYSYTGRKSDNILMASVCVPLMENDRFIGLTGADVELERVDKIADNIKPFDGSVILVVSNSGMMFHHPEEKNGNRSIEEFELSESDEVDILKSLKTGEAFSYTSKKDYYVSFAPLTLGRSNDSWYLGILVPTEVILHEANQNTLISLIVGLIGLIVLALVTWYVARNITTPLQQTTHILNNLAVGNVQDSEEIKITTHDELAEMSFALNTLLKALKVSADFATDIGKGNLENVFNPLSNEDMLGNALVQMRDSLIDLRKANDANAWMQDSIVKLSEVLQGEKSFTELGDQILSQLSEILDMQIASLFVEEEGILKLTSSYAYNIRKSNANEFKLGEGLVGQAALEQKTLVFTDVPDDYISIKSGLGERKPSVIVVVPLIFQNVISGVIEMGTVKELNPQQIEFLDQVSENIAIALRSISIRTEMSTLLNKTKEQAEELRVQQEELMEANKELQSQTNALKVSEEELREQQEELKVTNEELGEKTKHLEQQKAFISEKNLQLENAREDLERKAEELSIASKYKSEFLANMSHELRTPLNSLLILSRDLADNVDKNLSSEQVESAEIIYRSGNDLLAMINDILDLSKIESGKMDLNIEAASITDLTDSIYQYFKHITDQKGIELNISIEESLPASLSIDAQKVAQVLKNFMSNAIKFTSEGNITLKVHEVADDTELARSGLTNDEAIAFSVSDTGIGIPKEKQLEIFEAFQQADSSISRNFGGTGLGLSISRELAKLMGGEIQLNSVVDEGSTFTMFLPRQTQIKKETAPTKSVKKEKPEKTHKSHAAKKEISAPVPAKKKAKTRSFITDDSKTISDDDHVVLIIEDDPDFARVLVKECHKSGLKAIASPTGEEGLAMASKWNPAAIILDIRLPGINGWEVLDLLKENPRTRHIPVHIMSGDEPSIDATGKGAIGYLTKPISKNVLSEAFDNLNEFIKRDVRNLLVVEDDNNLRHSIIKVIGEKDIHITEADSGEKALQLLADYHYDCMILDLGLPDMNGFELIEAMDEQDLEKPPIIVYTGRELTKEENELLEKYAETVIIKGVKSEERLLDETALFMHRVVSKMPKNQQEIINRLYQREDVFKNKKLLLVDDDMRNIFALTKVMNEQGMNILRADNGKTAIEILEKEKDVDLILMDIMMPIMDGYEAMKHIRKMSGFRAVPIIALTAKAMKGDKQKCIDAGASDYMAKPINVEKLLSLMRVWLHK